MSRLTVLALCSTFALTACGAGIITGVAAGRDDSTAPQVPAAEPAITLSVDRGPLFIRPGERFEAAALLSNIDLPTDAPVVVDFVLPADGGRSEVVERQADVVVENLSTIRWRLQTDVIRQQFADATAQDVDIDVRIGADRGGAVELLASAPFRLLRRRVATLDPLSSTTVPIVGGSIALRVTPPVGPTPLAVVRTTSNRTTPALVSGRSDDDDGTNLILDVPAGETLEELFVMIIDAEAGASVEVGGVFYGPDLFAVVNRTGSTDGDERTSLIGAGLVPIEADPAGGQRLAFERVEIRFERGGRVSLVDPTRFLESASTPSALTFRSPQSPDGLPGSATVEVRVTLPTADGGMRVVSDREDDVFAYAASSPRFAPRGIGLPTRPEGVAFGRLADAASDVTDAAALFSSPIDFVGTVLVYRGEGNGMLRRHGVPVPTGEPGLAPVLLPVDIAVGDFTDDLLDDVMVANIGLGGTPLTSLLPNSAERRGLLAPFEPAIVISGELAERTFSASLEAPFQDDVIVAAASNFAYALRSEGLVPRWGRTEWPTVFMPGQYEVVRPLDQNQDGDSELAVVVRTSASPPRWSVSFLFRFEGVLTPVGPFDITSSLGAFEIRDLVGTARNGEFRLGLVLAPTGPGPWRFAEYRLDSTLDDLRVVDAFDLQPDFPVSAVSAITLDGDRGARLVFGSSTDSGLLEYRRAFDGAYTFEQAAEILDGERIGATLDMQVGTVDGEQPALFLTHEPRVGSSREVRISTLLIDANGKLLGPKAQRSLDGVPRGVVTANRERTRIVVVRDDVLQWFESDAFGQLSPSGEQVLPVPEVPDSLTRLTIGDDDWLVHLEPNGRVLASAIDTPPFAMPVAVNVAAVGAGTLTEVLDVAVGDVNADGADDVVYLAEYTLAGEEDTLACVIPLLGSHAAPTLLVPGRVEIVDEAVSVTLGNFIRENAGPPRLELAVARAEDGVQFFRIDDAALRLERISPTSGPDAITGREPSLIRAVDLDEDGADDIVIVSRSRSQVLFFRHLSPDVDQIDPDAFQLIDVASVAAGILADDLEVVDIDGDKIEDFVVRLRDFSNRPWIASILWNGIDGVRSLVVVDWRRIGTSFPSTGESRRFYMSIADTNRDDVDDLVLVSSPGQVELDLQAPDETAGRSTTVGALMTTLFGARR